MTSILDKITEMKNTYNKVKNLDVYLSDDLDILLLEKHVIETKIKTLDANDSINLKFYDDVMKKLIKKEQVLTRMKYNANKK